MMNIGLRQERYRKFYASSQPGCLLIVAHYAGGPPTLPLDFRDYDFTQDCEHRRYWDYQVSNLLISMDDRADLDDDWMPGIEPYYGFGT